MKGDPKVNFEKDWKMVTILVGHNDLCSIGQYRMSTSTNFGYYDFLFYTQSLTISQRNFPGHFCMKIGLCIVLGLITNVLYRHVEWHTPAPPTQMQIEPSEFPNCQKN